MFLFLFILFSVWFIFYIVRNTIFIHTSTMAAVMAFGILTQGVLNHYFGSSFFNTKFSNLILALVLALWTSFWVSVILTSINGKWKSLHYSNPVNRFGIGTWIAASSICGMLIFNYLPRLELAAEILAYLNAALWLFYVLISIQAFITILQRRTNKKVHGILLLTTVSTQSLILLFHTVFANVLVVVTIGLLTVGFCFYFLSFFLIMERYLRTRWSIETDWPNTNCILHGALSISGLASIVSSTASEHGILILWVFTATLFIIVECLEIYRLYRLVKISGWRKAIGTYDVSQWSRIFTFAMFYTFTTNLPVPIHLVDIVQKFMTQIGIWVILALVAIEIILVGKYIMKKNEKKQLLENTD